MAMFTLLIYALFKDCKKNSIEAMAKSTHTDYQKLQYFFSDSKWDIQALKHKRLEIIQMQRTTASKKTGFSPLMTQDFQSHSQKRPTENSGLKSGIQTIDICL